jgi:hypothetical protein
VAERWSAVYAVVVIATVNSHRRSSTHAVYAVVVIATVDTGRQGTIT